MNSELTKLTCRFIELKGIEIGDRIISRLKGNAYPAESQPW